MKKLISIQFILTFLFTVNSYGQQDTSLNQIFKPSLLGHENIKKGNDSTEFKVQSASRSLKYISDLPMTIYVITHDDIIKNGYITITDVLKSLPGVRVSQPGSGELGETFQFRGLLGNLYTKILINSIPIKPSGAAGMPIGSQLPIRQAERIEIIYGPAAAAYGADAVTGVINIILKEAQRGTFVRGDIFGGNSKYINFTIGGKAGKNRNILNYSFYGSKTEVSDFNIVSGHQSAYNPLYSLHQSGVKIDLGSGPIDPLQINESILEAAGVSVNDFTTQYYGANYKGSLTKPTFSDIGSSSQMLGLQLKFRGVYLSYNSMYRRNHSSIGLSPLLYRYDNPNNFWGEKIDQYALSFNHEWKRFTTTTNLSALSYQMDNSSSMGITRLRSDASYIYATSSDASLEELLTIFPFKNTEVLIGASAQISAGLPLTNLLSKPFNPNLYRSLKGSSLPSDSLMGRFGFNPYQFVYGSLFGQAFIVLNKFRIMGGIRYDGTAANYEGSTANTKSINPRIALLYKYSNNLSLIASFGTAYKAPPPSIAFRSMAYIPIEKPDSVKYLSLPNGNLKPEKYKSFEFGINSKLYKIVNVNISFFYDEITNLISNKLIPVDRSIYPLATAYNDSLWASTYVNASESVSELYGFQGEIVIKDIIRSIKLNVEVGGAISHKTDNLKKVNDVIGSFKEMPKHIGHFRVSAMPLRFSLITVDCFWTSKWLRSMLSKENQSVSTEIDGYFTTDITANIKLGENLNFMFKSANIFNRKYGGLGVTGLNYDLPYNPQTGRSFLFGLNYALN